MNTRSSSIPPDVGFKTPLLDKFYEETEKVADQAVADRITDALQTKAFGETMGFNNPVAIPKDRNSAAKFDKGDIARFNRMANNWARGDSRPSFRPRRRAPKRRKKRYMKTYRRKKYGRTTKVRRRRYKRRYY